MLGGTSGKVKKEDWHKWVLSVKLDPRPVKYTLAPIHYLLPDSHPKKNALIDATHDYLKKGEKEKATTIEAMKAVRPPPASICKRVEPHNDVLEEVNPSQKLNGEKSELKEQTDASRYKEDYDHVNQPRNESMETKPADVLCPFVGYHGAYCPTKLTEEGPKMEENGNARSLPRGVGLTIDVTTGELKLPALDYKDSTATWTDPSTQLTYAIPQGVTLSTVGVQAENKPTTRVFKTEDHLTSVWESGYKRGSWLGGEFGQSKGVLDLYEKLFSKQQATSINQHPRALYKLSLSPGWEKNLNAFVKIALQSLPVNYDANVYSRFMDTWGTHVGRNTLVGGMAEQQVVIFTLKRINFETSKKC